MSVLRRLRRVAGSDVDWYEGMPLPPGDYRMCGPDFKQHAKFIESGRQDAKRLSDAFGATSQSRILDIGSGVGRLALGFVAEHGPPASYIGIDVDQQAVKWASRHLTKAYPGCRFERIDVDNARYNPSGSQIDSDFRFPFADGSFDLIYTYSVFSHMETAQVAAYMGDFRRLLARGGGVFLTAFVEEDVPDMEVNPAGYQREWEGELHCVRYDRRFFETLVTNADLQIVRFDHQSEAQGDGQSAIYLG